MMKPTLILLVLMMTAANASVDGIGEPNVAWKKRQIHVCWHNAGKDNPSYAPNDFKIEQKLAVQQIVEQEYTVPRVGITFFGWEDCSTITNYDLEIYQDIDILPTNNLVDIYRKAKVEGFSVLGQGGREEKTNEHDGYFNRNQQLSTMYLLYQPMFRIGSEFYKPTEELQATALHEFGHAAGLRHEHIRPEAKDDPNCKNMNFVIDETILDSAINYEDYDPNSIMNYCWSSTLGLIGNVVNVLPNVPDQTLYTVTTNKKTKKKTYFIRNGLSAKDISTLNKMYPKQ